MSKKSITRDELFLLKLRELALDVGDETAEVDRYVVGRAIGHNDKSIDGMARHLLQTNFIRKGDDDNVYLTPHGLRLLDQISK